MVLNRKFPHEIIDALNITYAKYKAIFENTALLINTALPISLCLCVKCDSGQRVGSEHLWVIVEKFA